MRFCEGRPDYRSLERSYERLLTEPGVGVLTAQAGLGKTRAMRHLRDKLAQGRTVLRVDGEEATPEAPWRVFAATLGVDSSQKRRHVWRVVALEVDRSMVTGSGCPLLVVDEAQHVSHGFLVDLADFLDALDWRVSVWLVGLPSLAEKILDPRHATLLRRVVAVEALLPLDLDAFAAMMLGDNPDVRADDVERLWQESGGIPRRASKLLKARAE